jgi:hypothetical protein
MMADSHATIRQRPDAAVEGGAGDPTPTSEVPEMNPQTMQRGATSVDPNPTAAAELAADDTLARLTRAREDADTPDDAVAEQAWRQVSRLASRLNVQARTIARTLEGAVIDQRDVVAASLLANPDETRGRAAR